MEFDVLPAVSSALNAATTAVLLVGWRRIKRKDVEGHRHAMVLAMALALLFLVSYVVHHALHGTHGSSATGGMRVVYLAILGTHTALAIAIAILVPRVAWLAFKGDFGRHRTLAKITLPIWLYVSVTGIVVYVMAYHLWPAATAT